MSDSILAAAAKAANDAVLTEAATSHQATPIDEAEVAALVATLPKKAADGKVGDVGAEVFLFHEWDPRNRRAAEVAGATRDRLVALGLSVVVENVRVGLREVPGRLVVDYADLDAAARREEATKAAWVDEARRAWVRVGGEGADVREVVARSGKRVARFSTRAMAVPVGDASPFRLDFLLRAREREIEVVDYWLSTVVSVVEFIEGAIRPVRWTQAEIEAAAARRGSFVSFSYGLFEGGTIRQGAVIEFRKGEASYKRAIEDVRTIPAEELAALADTGMVASEFSEEKAALERPDVIPAHLVAGEARDRNLGIKNPEQRDTFVYVAPPGPKRVHFGDAAPVDALVNGANPEGRKVPGDLPGEEDDESAPTVSHHGRIAPDEDVPRKGGRTRKSVRP